jgi:hypothetical protein
MPIQLSKFLLALEALCILVPLTLLFGIWSALHIFQLAYPTLNFAAWLLEMTISVLLAGLLLCIALELSVRFIFGGIVLLQAARIWKWRVSYAGAVASLVALAMYLPNLHISFFDAKPEYHSVLLGYLYGSPLIIPLVHLWLERTLRTPQQAGEARRRVATRTDLRESRDALKAAVLVAGGGTALSVVITLFSGQSVTKAAVAGLLGGWTTFWVMLLIALLPMPAAVLCRKYLPRVPAIVAFALSLASALFLVFAVLRLIESPPIETDGDTTIYRYAGPTVDASKKISYYFYSLPIIFASLVIFHWMLRRRVPAFKTMEPME